MIGGTGNKDSKKITFKEGTNVAFTFVKTGTTGGISYLGYFVNFKYICIALLVLILDPICEDAGKCTNPAFVTMTEGTIKSESVTLPFVAKVSSFEN